MALGYDVPLPVDSLTPVDGFRSYQSLFERHQALDADNATVAGQIVGQTLAGRDVWVYVIGDADRTTADGGSEAAALINGTIHAREWQSPEAVTEIYEQLVEIQADGGFGQYLSENLSVLIVPVLNVDGFTQTQRYPDRFTAAEAQPRDGRMRRKNMQSPGGVPVDEDIDATTDNFFGVDLNRNSPRGWGLNGGSSNDPVSLVYRGPAAQSEPEIQALVAASELAPVTRLRFFSDVHSFSQIFFTPLTGNGRRDQITANLVGRMRAVLGNKYRYGAESGSGIGLTSDYFARTFQIPAWTLEIEPLSGGVDYGGTNHGHSGFVLPDDQVARMRDEVASMVLAGLYRQTDAPRVQAVEIRDQASGELRYAASWVADGDGRRLDVSTDRALVPGPHTGCGWPLTGRCAGATRPAQSAIILASRRRRFRTSRCNSRRSLVPARTSPSAAAGPTGSTPLAALGAVFCVTGTTRCRWPSRCRKTCQRLTQCQVSLPWRLWTS